MASHRNSRLQICLVLPGLFAVPVRVEIDEEMAKKSPVMNFAQNRLASLTVVDQSIDLTIITTRVIGSIGPEIVRALEPLAAFGATRRTDVIRSQATKGFGNMHTRENNCTYPRFCSRVFAIFAFLSLAMSAAVIADQTTPPGTLEWNELVPDGWQPPLILPAPPEDGATPVVDRASLVRELDGKKVSIAGFMVPMKFDSNIVSEFLLVPFLDQHVQGHIHHDSNQMVYVYLQEPRAIQNPYIPVLVKGEMKLRSVDTDEGQSGYVIEQGSMEDYTY